MADGGAEVRGELDAFGPWFGETGELLRPIPQECVDECAVGGCDNYEACKEWVRRLDLVNGLDTGMARGYVLASGGWSRDELLAMSDEEIAIKLLWLLVWDIADYGQDCVNICAERLERDGAEGEGAKTKGDENDK